MPDLSNLSNFPEDKLEISAYLSWDKNFIDLAKKSMQIMRYSVFSFLKKKHTCVCCGYASALKHLGELLLMSNHHIYFL